MKRTYFNLLGVVLATFGSHAAADPVSEFYTGKQVRLVISFPVGGDYDLYGRLLARHIGKHINGQPSIVPMNMPGGAGIVAANFVAKVAPKDGTVLAMVGQGVPFSQALDLNPGLTADTNAFNWIGNLVNSNQIIAVWHTSPIKTLAQAKNNEVLVGASGSASIMAQLPAFTNNILGTKFKIIMGYTGGQQTDLAMERGEIHGRGSNSVAGYNISKPDYIKKRLIVPLIQIGLERDPALQDIPLLNEQQVDAKDKALLEFISKAVSVGRPFAVADDVPGERVAALRKAFDLTVTDPQFLDEARRMNADIRAMSGEVLGRLVRDLIEAPQEVRSRVKYAVQPKRGDTSTKGKP